MEVAALIGVNQKCPSVAAEVIAAFLGELQSVTIAFQDDICKSCAAVPPNRSDPGC